MSKITILVTGTSGMIGSHVTKRLLEAGMNVVGIDRCGAIIEDNGYTHYSVDLGKPQDIAAIFEKHDISRVIHLAALAHTHNETDLSFERYVHVNVECAKNIFSSANDNNVPLLFISTVDVFGFTNGIVTTDTVPHPVTNYGKSKLMAEKECEKICKDYTIFRLSPVYTPEIKRDIQKRYYLKSPKWAYIIGKGTQYEVVNIDVATERMVAWCTQSADNKIHIIKDATPLITSECI